MNSRLQNQLAMVGSCITIANSAEHKLVWDGKDPADFGTDLPAVQAAYGAVTAKAAQAEAASGGAADTKTVAETTLEDAAFVLARALAVHFKKTGNLTDRAKVDVSKREIMKLRTQELVNKTTVIRDLGTTAVSQPDAAKRGVTAARVAALTAAIAAFSSVMNAPRGEIVNRSALLREVETDIAALLDAVSDLHDLVLQFDGTDEGRLFIEALKRARIIVDSGGGHSAPAPTPTPTPTPNP
ncbi:MAG: hypothetical protein EBY09_12690 [Verrucomicrobia bacterium]|nr:hypothetical protein [Verrucomicrobiota bacterium]NBU07436.1 hypothetical protein [Pseudomonadota bacterium]NDA67474.1 hypothetical protein [Verrucomicrobiota bacterium]NDD39382.1 hypothetical protein [Verrucomicrobiota bacterium]NDE99267.1 hypothetical protein [Verrucomicrobiota bacterium]